MVCVYFCSHVIDLRGLFRLNSSPLYCARLCLMEHVVVNSSVLYFCHQSDDGYRL